MRGFPRAFLAVIAVSLLVGGLVGPAAGAGIGQHASAASPAAPNARLQMYEALVNAATAAQIIEDGYDVVTVETAPGDQVLLVLVLYPWERAALEKQGVDLRLWTNDDGLTATELAAQQLSSGFKVWRDYDGPDGLRRYMDDVEAANEDLIDLHVLGTTHQGRDIVALRLTDEAVGDDKPAVLYSSLQHAREWIGGEVSDETYRGPFEGSEPETQAIVDLYAVRDFAFHVNYHSFGELLLYTFGWQVQTPSADDPIFVALSGTDKKPAIQHFNPGVGADLYITNGETTDWAHAQGTLAWTPELSEGPNGDGFIFPDSRGAVQNEFKKLLPFSRDVALSATDPDDPISHLGNTTEPFYLDVSEIDPQKAFNPLSDFTFDHSYGDPQTVEVLAKRDLDGDGVKGPGDDVTVHWRVNGGSEQSAATAEWDGGDRFGAPGDLYYRIVRGEVTGFDPGDRVEVWFSGGGHTSGSFTFDVVTDVPEEILILAAEDYSGPANWPVYTSPSSPNYLSYYEDALTDAGYSYDVYDVDAMGRVAPDHLGVLSHYGAVVWYMANDYLTREPGQVPGTGASTLANSEVLEVRSYLNEGGSLLFTGVHAGWQNYNAFPYNPVSTPPFCDGTVPNDTGVGCLLLSDDFFQYWLGSYLFIEEGGTDPVDGEPFGIVGTAGGAFDGQSWTLNGGSSADNHHPNPIRGTTFSLLTTSSLLPDSPQFASAGHAAWDTGVAGAFSPHTGDRYVFSDRGDVSYKRLMTTVSPTAGDEELSFFVSYDTEPSWDFLFVEAHTPGQDDWTTLPELGGATSNDTGDSCPEGWHELHPSLVTYQGTDCSGAGWNAASGRSAGWESWSFDLSAWNGGEVEVSISYVSDWAVQGLGVFVDDIDAPGTEDDTGFETDLGTWTVPGAPTTNPAPNPNDWFRTEDVGFVEAAAVSSAPEDANFRTLYLAFGFEGIMSDQQRNDVMAGAIGHLLGP
jgi:hypothetical protein